MATVFELLADAAAHLKPEIGRNGHIPSIKETVDVTTQENTVGGIVLAALRERTDVSGVQGRKGFLACDRTTAVIDISDEQGKRTLSQPRLHEPRLAVACLRRFHESCAGQAGHCRLNSIPQLHPFWVGGRVALKRHNVPRPTVRNG